MNTERVLRAIANSRRLQILDWLRSPTKHFPPQVDGDLIRDGVCGARIAQKLGVSHVIVRVIGDREGLETHQGSAS